MAYKDIEKRREYDRKFSLRSSQTLSGRMYRQLLYITGKEIDHRSLRNKSRLISERYRMKNKARIAILKKRWTQENRVSINSKRSRSTYKKLYGEYAKVAELNYKLKQEIRNEQQKRTN